jgi:uncharacterized protein YyaL (SSP411 family)
VAGLGAALLVLGIRAEASSPPGRIRVPAALPGAPALPEALREKLTDALEARGAGYVPRTRNLHPDGSPIYTNRLILEASPYLQQHAHNPVNWYPWGDEAFEMARRLSRPVLVSIGYSTCHWCHVMEEESFDVPAIARVLNEHFIAVKVDRESRPDVDAVYMDAMHALNVRGGWPLNVFVTPDRKPFYGGTYFPPTDRDGRTGFPSLLKLIHERYTQDRTRVDALAERVSLAVAENLESASAQSTSVPGAPLLERASLVYAEHIDAEWGGLGGHTKFPSSVPIRLLLRYPRTHVQGPGGGGAGRARELALLTLEKMAAGGIYDHVGGGFHRYSTDARWLVPHFEKMLYDNALLAVTYLEAGQATGRDDFTRVAREILRYVAREMTSPEGAFYSATDADSMRPDGEVEEGWFFTWTPAEIQAVVSGDVARVFQAYYGVTTRGNFEGRSILHAWRDAGQVARELELDRDSLERKLAEAREALYDARAARPAPLRDEKILVAWNGLMISAFAQASFVLAEPGYAQHARRAADFMLEQMRGQDGRLRRMYKDGRADGPAFLEDYAFFIAGLLDLYEADPDLRWLREALALQQKLEQNYADSAGGGYFRTANDGERLLAREKPRRDGPVPSGNSIAAMNLLRLAEFTGDADYTDRAILLFSAYSDALERSPSSLTEMLMALDYYHGTTKEIVVVRPPSGGEIEPMLAPIRNTHLPNRILSVVTEGADLEAHATIVPLVRGKTARRGRVTAYVCENRVCKFPTSDPDVLAKQLVAMPSGKGESKSTR